jgi:hypothetical protein
VAKAIIVKSGIRKKTNDRLVGIFAALTFALPADMMTRTGLSLTAKRHQEPFFVNGYSQWKLVIFATWSQIGQSLGTSLPFMRQTENRRRAPECSGPDDGFDAGERLREASSRR